MKVKISFLNLVRRPSKVSMLLFLRWSRSFKFLILEVILRGILKVDQKTRKIEIWLTDIKKISVERVTLNSSVDNLLREEILKVTDCLITVQSGQIQDRIDLTTVLRLRLN